MLNVKAAKHPFGFSLFKTFGKQDWENEMDIKLNFYSRNDVLLSLDGINTEYNNVDSSSSNNEQIYKLKIGRHKTCPLKTTTNWSEEERILLRESLSTEKRKFNFMQIAVAVLVENEPTNEVLITKRPKHM